MVGKLPVQVMEPEIARLFCAEAKDIGVALQRLYADARGTGRTARVGNGDESRGRGAP